MALIAPNTTQTPDEIFDYWMHKALLSHSELCVLLYVVRRTLGFQKQVDAISVSQLANGIAGCDVGTGFSERVCLLAVRSLVDKGLLKVEHRVSARGRHLSPLYSLDFRKGDAGIRGGVMPASGMGDAGIRGGVMPASPTRVMPASDTTNSSSTNSSPRTIPGEGSRRARQLHLPDGGQTGRSAPAMREEPTLPANYEQLLLAEPGVQAIAEACALAELEQSPFKHCSPEQKRQTAQNLRRDVVKRWERRGAIVCVPVPAGMGA